MALVRVGECKQCGRCCRRFGQFGVLTKNLDWLHAHMTGIDVQQDPEDPAWHDVMLPIPCRQLWYNGRGRAECRLHLGNKPRLCRDYPLESQRDDLYPGCAFRFEEG